MTDRRIPKGEEVLELGPWRHDIDLGRFSTFDVAERRGPYADIGHPKSRYRFARMFLPEPPASVLDVGCNAGGVTFRLERDGYEAVGLDSGIDPGLQSPNPAVFAEGDAEGLWEREADPIEQARYCKEVRGSSAGFVRADAFSYLSAPGATYDVVVSFGVLYHVHEGKDVDREEEAKRFVDLLLDSARERVLIETSLEGYEWLSGYCSCQEDAVVTASVHPVAAPPGVRHFVAVDVGGGD